MYNLTTPFALAQFISAGTSIIVTFICWKRRNVRGGKLLLLLFIAISEWTFCNGMEAAATLQEKKIFWSQLAYIGVQTSPVLLMLFALSYTGRKINFKVIEILLLFAIPILIIILAATNQVHGLLWVGFSPGPEGTNSLIYHHGPAFWLSMAYVFTMVTFATTFIIISAVNSQKIYRIQSYILLLTAVMPWVGTILYIFNINPFQGLDTVSISFVFTGILLMLGISKGKMMNYIPIAHELLFENIGNGIVVFDEDLRVMDINPAAERILAMSFKQLLGKSLYDHPKVSIGMLKYFSKDETSRFEMISPFNNQIWFNVSITPLRHKQNGFFGWVLYFEDITSRKETEKKMQEMNQELEHQLKEIRELEDQLREQANRDSLTGVYNRGYLDETLKREVARAARYHYPLSVIMLDIDHFKMINDTYGHKVGDDVIVALGKLLERETREEDCVSRYGGDEFVLIMPEMSRKDAFERAEFWREECKGLKVRKSKQIIRFTVSAGIASYPENGTNNESLLSTADQALYKAKQLGRDRTSLASD